MFVRVDNVLINLDEIHTAFLDTSVLDSRPILKLQMKGGMRSSIDSEADPELVFNVIIEALSSTGQLYSPADPDMPIELSFLEEQQLDAVAKLTTTNGHPWLFRSVDVCKEASNIAIEWHPSVAVIVGIILVLVVAIHEDIGAVAVELASAVCNAVAWISDVHAFGKGWRHAGQAVLSLFGEVDDVLSDFRRAATKHKKLNLGVVGFFILEEIPSFLVCSNAANKVDDWSVFLDECSFRNDCSCSGVDVVVDAIGIGRGYIGIKGIIAAKFR